MCLSVYQYVPYGHMWLPIMLVIIIYLYLGCILKTIFLVLHFKIKLFSMHCIVIDYVGKDKATATARRRSCERTLSWTNWLVQ